jgi:thioredoxin reductase
VHSSQFPPARVHLSGRVVILMVFRKLRPAEADYAGYWVIHALMSEKLSVDAVEIAIIGAGPYGLSLAAHLRRAGRSLRIFGVPMRFWSNHMPEGMLLKSEGFASNLYDPDGEFTLKAYCKEKNIPYADIGLPVHVENFIAYGLEFQRRHVPELESVQVRSLSHCAQGFELVMETGEIVRARRVVVATGIMNFAHLPPLLAALPSESVTHSSRHHDLLQFKGRRVAILGAGASALDVAVLLQRVGALTQLFARGPAIDFNAPPREPRPLLERLKSPRSGLGTGWKSRMCTDLPMVFHALPKKLRFRAMERHLGPAACWFTRREVEGRLPMHLGATLAGADAPNGLVRLVFDQAGEKGPKVVEVDHVIAATGYKVALSRLGFIDPSIRSRIGKASDTPILDRHFESSIPGLFFVGAAAAYSFGPLLRFAFGARFAAERLSNRLARD